MHVLNIQVYTVNDIDMIEQKNKAKRHKAYQLTTR